MSVSGGEATLMRFRSSHDFRRWVVREILGQDIGRKPQRKPPTKASTASGKPIRNYKYRAWIRSLPSAVSGEGPCDACHTGTDGGIGQKSSDLSCIPLTRQEHQEYHQIGKKDFERKYGLDLFALVQRLNRIWSKQWQLSDEDAWLHPSLRRKQPGRKERLNPPALSPSEAYGLRSSPSPLLVDPD